MFRLGMLALLLAVVLPAMGQNSSETQSKTVLGPRNPNLYDGANALKAGNGPEGVRLTLLGLNSATTERDRKAAHSNLCAGYLMLNQLETALRHCNWVLERDERHWRTYNNRALVYLEMGRYEESRLDIEKGQALAPNSEKLKEVKGRYMDEVEPVAESITINDRRRQPAVRPKAPEQ